MVAGPACPEQDQAGSPTSRRSADRPAAALMAVEELEVAQHRAYVSLHDVGCVEASAQAHGIHTGDTDHPTTDFLAPIPLRHTLR